MAVLAVVERMAGMSAVAVVVITVVMALDTEEIKRGHPVVVHIIQVQIQSIFHHRMEQMLTRDMEEL